MHVYLIDMQGRGTHWTNAGHHHSDMLQDRILAHYRCIIIPYFLHLTVFGENFGGSVDSSACSLYQKGISGQLRGK